jgi:phage/plasmid-associated DNA primase
VNDIKGELPLPVETPGKPINSAPASPTPSVSSIPPSESDIQMIDSVKFIRCHGTYGDTKDRGCGMSFTEEQMKGHRLCPKCWNEYRRERDAKARDERFKKAQGVREAKTMKNEEKEPEDEEEDGEGDDEEKVFIGMEDEAVILHRMLEQVRVRNELRLYDLCRVIVYYYKDDLTGAGLAEFVKLGKKIDVDEDKCAKMYEDCRYIKKAPPRTVKDLAAMIRNDTPKAYQTWHDAWKEFPLTMMLATGGVGHVDVANLLFRDSWLDVQYDGRHWQVFQGGVWVDQGKECEYLKGRMDFLRSKVNAKAATLGGKELKTASLLYHALGKASFRRDVLSCSQERFINRKFGQWKDSYGNITGIQNGGCVVAHGNTLYIRDARPQDYLTRQSNARWNPLLSEENVYVKLLMKWLEQMFPDKEQFRMFKTVWCLGFCGNKIKMIPFYLGDGDNGKTTMQKFILVFWGNYATAVSETFFNKDRKKGAGGLDPERAATIGARFFIVSEPEDGMSSRLFKAIIEDPTFVRSCAENGGMVEPSAIPIISCNHLPRFVGIDLATIRRILTILFEARYPVDPREVPESPEEQMKQHVHKRDPNWKDKLDRLCDAMLWLCKEWYTEIMNEIDAKGNVIVPEKSRSTTEEHVVEMDSIHAFFKERLRLVVNPEESKMPLHQITPYQTINKVYAVFKPWYLQNYDKNVPKREQVLKALSSKKMMGPRQTVNKSERWFGWDITDEE